MDVLAVATAARAEGPLCDPCLGRVVADRSHGLSNAERGAAMRVGSQLQEDTPMEPLEPEACWVCGGLTEGFDAWADRCVAAVGETEFETYQVGSRPPPLVVENDRLLRELIGVDPEAGESIRSELNREVGKRIGALTDTTVEFTRPHVQFILDVEADSVVVEVNSAFVYGRY
ncbi:MAG: THUMP domain-containing protein, partial [Haloquadratum sp.]|nr:THUMP domain-containing protein [Haloquadratum sp.]